MTTVKPLTEFLSRLAQRFDENVRTNASDPSKKGWGQFIAAEHHSNQIGLYGTSAGLLVKSIANPNSPIDDAISNYLTKLWADRQGEAQKYFNQTVRLAFLVLALAHSSDAKLRSLRDEAVAELIRRQHSDGAWGDWDQPGTLAPPRPETTAWIILSLVRLGQSGIRPHLASGARFLQKYASSFSNSFSEIENEVDPLVLAAIAQALPAKEISSRIRAAAIRVLLRSVPSADVQIYFFDYPLNEGAVRQVKRDYLCVPRFLPYCILAGAPALRPKRWSIRSLRLDLAHWQATTHLEKVLILPLLQTPRSRYPATVDQAFVALAVEFISRRPPQFGTFFTYSLPLYRAVTNNFAYRVLLPLFIVSFLGAVAHEPANVAEFVAWLRGQKSETLSKFAEHNASIVQISAIALGFLLGQPLLLSIRSYIRDRWKL